MTIAAIIFFLLVASVGFFYFFKKKKNNPLLPLPESYRTILRERVSFYNKLEPERQKEFEERIQNFLSQVRITGVKTRVDDIDRVLIAASAVITIFNFKGWEYVNLHEVLLYPNSFNHDFELEGTERNVAGMVGSGALNHVMILSQQELRHSFSQQNGTYNAAIHEFVHLVDKTDGAVDGIPEFIMDKKYVMPWLQLMRKEIEAIYANQSDINPYGATNEAEFFAVVSEYFFEQPERMKERHPELYALLSRIFQPAAQHN